MTFFGKTKRKQTSPEASRKPNPINNDNKNKLFQAQTSLNPVPAPPYMSPAALQTNRRPPPQSPYRYPPPGNPVSQANLAAITTELWRLRLRLEGEILHEPTGSTHKACTTRQ